MNPDPDEDTEWNDILRARGILPPRESDEERRRRVDDEIEESMRDRLDRQNDLDRRTTEELDELEEDEMDDRVVAEYRARRIREMIKETAATATRFGGLRQISRPDFVREVTEASRECWVVVHLFQDYIPLCKLMNDHMTALADRHGDVKFLKIVADRCVEGYPDRNVPTLLVYRDGDVRANWVGPLQFGGMGLTLEGLRKKLVDLGALPKGVQDFEDAERRRTSPHQSNPATAALSDDEDESDD